MRIPSWAEEFVVRYAFCPPVPVVRAIGLLPPFWGAKLFESKSARIVGLSLDDGPDPELTPRVLDVLERHRSHATFFFLGEASAAAPEVVDAVYLAGHEVGNHTMRDEPSAGLSASELLSSLTQTHAILTEDRQTAVSVFRPGGGLPGRTGWVTRLARRPPHGYTTVLASIYPQDVRIRNDDVIVRGILRRLQPGAIIALHEGATPEGQPNRQRVVSILDRLLAEVKARGYEVVTTSRLLGR